MSGVGDVHVVQGQAVLQHTHMQATRYRFHGDVRLHNHKSDSQYARAWAASRAHTRACKSGEFCPHPAINAALQEHQDVPKNPYLPG